MIKITVLVFALACSVYSQEKSQSVTVLADNANIERAAIEKKSRQLKLSIKESKSDYSRKSSYTFVGNVDSIDVLRKFILSNYEVKNSKTTNHYYANLSNGPYFLIL